MNNYSDEEVKKFVLNYYNSAFYSKVNVKGVSVEQRNKKNFIIIDVDPIGLVIGKHGVNIKQANEDITKEFDKTWKIEIKPDLKIPGSGQRGKKHDDKRAIISRDNLPMAVPFSSLSNEKMINIFSKQIDENGPILVTLFRDSMEYSENKLLREVPGKMNKRMLNFTFHVIEKFPGKNVTLFNWPDILRSEYDTKRTSHPYISYCCRAAVIVHNDEHDISDKELFKQSLFFAVHDWTKLESKDKWVILGDETGSLDEFKTDDNTTEEVKSTMCWVVIPPKTNLESLPYDFHCAGYFGNENYKLALKNLLKHSDIMFFTFGFEEGDAINNSSDMGNDPHLSFWQDTLPLVLESISSKIKTKKGIDVFIEQVGPLESGNGIISPIITELVTALKTRGNWPKLNFDQLWVISKGEHPWIGYPDAIGANINRKKFEIMKKEKDKVLDKQIYDEIFQSPYRQSSLNGVVRQALKETARPLSFLRFLYEIKEEDVRDYVKPFLGPAINESISALSQGDWQKLLEHMDTHSSSKQGQYVSELIHGFVDIDLEINKLNQEKDRFDFALAMLGTSNHIGAKDQAVKCISICNELLKSGYKPRKNREIKFKNLQGGIKDNQFDFSHIDDDLVLPTKDEFDEEWNRYLGAQALSRALSYKDSGLGFAIEIEKYLLRNTTDFNDLKRRWIMNAELQFEVGDNDEAMSALEVKLPKAVDSNVDDLLGDGYYLASFLKGCAMYERPKTDFNKFANAVISCLNEHHPSQRIAYWCLRWANQIGENNSDIAKVCKNHLIELKNEPLFTHDAPGVILSCELMDLESRGYKINVDTMKFYELVKKNSQPSTIEWLKKHPPNEDDWLAPLNFNYR